MAGAPIPGLAVGIVSGEDLIYSAGFGVANRATGQAITDSTLFQIGSTTKSFTATLMGLLRDEGLLSFDDPASAYLPSDLMGPYRAEVPPVTLRHLATHTAGIPRQPPTLRRAHGDAPVLAFTHFELYQSIEAAELESAPGERFSYSNFGYAILGHALERAADVPYETLLTQRLLFPLRMRWTTVTLWPRHLERLALPYYPNPRTGAIEDYTPWDTEALSPAGGVTSSVRDMARFVALHMRSSDDERAPVAGSTIHELHAPQATLNPTTAYALGWIVRELEGVGRIVEHGGEVDGYTSYVGFSPDRRIGVVILVNAGSAPLGELGDGILKRAVEAAG